MRVGDFVEPDEPEQPVRADASEQVLYLLRLVCGRCRACLGDQYRVAGQLAYGNDGRPEYRSELPGRLR